MNKKLLKSVKDMEENVLFSVIVTIYNAEKYLHECIDSIIQQTYSNIEILLVDDGSVDQSGPICDEYAQKDQRVQVIHQTNKGLVAARISGIINARGKYIVFVDSDDWIDANMCSIFAQHIEETHPDILLAGLIKEYDNRSQGVTNVLPVGYYDSKKMHKEVYPRMIYTGRFFEKGLETYVCSRAISREIMVNVAGIMNLDISFGEGGVWLYLCLLQATSIFIVDSMPYHYRMRSDSMSIQMNTDPKITIIYETLLKNIMAFGNNVNQLIWQLDHMIMYLYIWKELPLLNSQNTGVLYPYVDLKKGSRVVIYGAWRFGRELYLYIKQSGFCEVVLWVDQNAEKYRNSELDIQLPEKILETDYDYILLGTMVYSGIQSMKKKLSSMGIEDNIIYVNENVVSSEYLPKDCRHLKEKYVNVCIGKEAE